MNNTRIFSPVVVMSVAIVAILLLSLGFAAWSDLSGTSIAFEGLSARQGGPPEPAALQVSRENAEGLAIYHKSERTVALPRANVEGTALYHESEWGSAEVSSANVAGLETYRLSERNSSAPAVPGSTDEGMAIYHLSERSFAIAALGAASEEGMEIYRASEKDR